MWVSDICSIFIFLVLFSVKRVTMGFFLMFYLLIFFLFCWKVDMLSLMIWWCLILSFIVIWFCLNVIKVMLRIYVCILSLSIEVVWKKLWLSLFWMVWVYWWWGLMFCGIFIVCWFICFECKFIVNFWVWRWVLVSSFVSVGSICLFSLNCDYLY